MVYSNILLLQVSEFYTFFRKIAIWAHCAGCILTLARSPEASAYHLRPVQNSPTLARWASGLNVAIHHNKFIHIFACLYSENCVSTHFYTITELACCANLIVMLSCIAIMTMTMTMTMTMK